MKKISIVIVFCMLSLFVNQTAKAQDFLGEWILSEYNTFGMSAEQEGIIKNQFKDAIGKSKAIFNKNNEFIQFRASTGKETKGTWAIKKTDENLIIFTITLPNAPELNMAYQTKNKILSSTMSDPKAEKPTGYTVIFKRK